MIIYLNKKVTANELAKLIVWDKGEMASDYWDEDTSIEYYKMTEKERADVNRALDRHRERVRDFLGIDVIAERRGLFQGTD
jgi:hypothetical protein